jgi:uncharacterized protein YidB (DUF937 family)
MGRLDFLNGMKNVPRGISARSRKGLSPITIVLLGLLAYKAVKHVGASSGSSATAGSQIGVLGGLLAGLGSSGLGGVLSRGLGDLLNQFQNSGKGDIAQSWVGNDQNEPIAPNDLAKVLGRDQIEFLSQCTGMPRDTLLARLSEHLPAAVDELTPDGKVPTPEELDRI